jgi:biopolymer transport protein ExbD
MKIGIKTKAEADVNITSLIDCLMMVIIFFMVIMSAQYIFGVAIKFPSGGGKPQTAAERQKQKEEKNIIVYVSADDIDTGHSLRHDGILKLNGEEILLTVSSDREKWPAEREQAWKGLESEMKKLIDKGYKKDMLMVQGEMKTYHGKTMKVIDIGKNLEIDGFSLVPPTK